MALPRPPPANQQRVRRLHGPEFLPQKEKAHDDDLRGLPEAGRRRRQLLRVRHRGDHPPADGRQALGAEVRVADAFLSTDRGFYMYWIDEALQTLNWAVLPVGAYTGARLAAWISSNYGSATYVEQTNEIGVAYDGNRRILNDYEIRSLFPGSGSYPAGATPSRPLSINHLLGPSFIEGALQIFTFVTMAPYNELFLRCSTLATAADIKGPLGQDIIAKMIIDKGVGHIMQTRTDEGHFVKLHGPITLRTLRFKLTDVDGNVVNTRGTSVSFAIFLDYET